MMPLRRLVSSIPLRISEVTTLAPVRARNLGLSLAGRARLLYELATGSDAAGDGGASPLNPQGRLGADLSGPPFGPCLQVPLCVVPGTRDENHVDGEEPIHNFDVNGEVFNFVMRVWVRPFVSALGNEPLTRGYLALSYNNPTGAGTATATAEIANLSIEDGFRRPMSASLSSTSTTASKNEDLWVPLRPGVNLVQLTVRHTSSVDLTLLRCSLNQVQLLEH